jgi:glycosyltransferase involved in cell wall biosynthesis
MIRSALFRPIATLGARMRAERGYRQALRDGRAAGTTGTRFVDWRPADPALVEVRVRADGPHTVNLDDARRWCRRQTLSELRVVGFDADGNHVWRIEPSDPALIDTEAAWFAAPGGLPDVDAAHYEQCLLVAAAEMVDAVVIREGVDPPLGASVQSADAACNPTLRVWALFRSSAYEWRPERDAVEPSGSPRLVKLVDTHGVHFDGDDPAFFNHHRRGPYLTDSDPGAVLTVGIRDAARLARRSRPKEKKSVLVLLPFLAHGGIEHVLAETMAVLAERYDISFVTLAPHRPELGDRRPAFRDISPRLYSLGDLVHPDAMYGMLGALVDSLETDIVFNANGTTIFYDVVERLRRDRPAIRIIDHLYDHRVGYIERYHPGLARSIDACVAVNRRIADELTEHRGWPPERVPVIHPCGRSDDALPPIADRPLLRARLRRELGFADDDIVVLTAARMHPQKRPLDLVALARRLVDLEDLHFVIVGGGELEQQVDDAISEAADARIRRLAFRDDVPDLIVASDLGCLVSDFEGLPVFFIECLQLGRPFLGTRVGELGVVLDETGAGIVVDRPGDLDAIEAALRRLSDPVVRASKAERALEAAPRFSVATCAEAYAAVFEGGG